MESGIDPHIDEYYAPATPSYIARYIAHSLTYDLVASGETSEIARDRLNTVIEVQLEICNGMGSNPLFPAPYRFWEQYWGRNA